MGELNDTVWIGKGLKESEEGLDVGGEHAAGAGDIDDREVCEVGEGGCARNDVVDLEDFVRIAVDLEIEREERGG